MAYKKLDDFVHALFRAPGLFGVEGTADAAVGCLPGERVF
jgi:hypothetical protein